MIPLGEFGGETGGGGAKQVLLDIYDTTSHLDTNGVVLGWGPDEGEFVFAASANNSYVHASDYCKNVAMLSSLSLLSSHKNTINTSNNKTNSIRSSKASKSTRDSRSNSKEERSVRLQNNDKHRHVNATNDNDDVHTVCFLTSDGDNLQWLFGSFFTDPRWFASGGRGAVPSKTIS